MTAPASQLLGPDGQPITVRDRRASRIAGPTPAAITAQLSVEGMSATSSPFGPGQPIRPSFGYSRSPRRFDYPAGANITSQPRAAYHRPSFDTLRAIINAYDIARACINHRIDSLRAKDLLLLPADDFDGDADLPIKAARAALAYPDRELPFDVWVSKWAEGLFRYDAACLYRRRNRAGQVIALEVVDGTTITPFVDEYGRRPLPPAPAYGQIIKGVPWDWMTTDDLIYTPFRPQDDSPYGLAPIESVLLTANTDLRLQWHMLNYFTAGSMPGGFMSTPPDAQTPEQVEEWQDYWDALMLGDQEALRQIKMLPTGMIFTPGRDATYDEQFALSMIRRTCAAYGVVPNDLGLTMDVNRANGETQTDVQERINDKPADRFLLGILTRYLQHDLGLPVKVEFDQGQDDDANLAEAQRWEILVNMGAASPDEARTKLTGLPIDNERPVPRFFVSKQGPIPLVDVYSIAGPVDPDTAGPTDALPIPAQQFEGVGGAVPLKEPGDTDFERAPVDLPDGSGPIQSTATTMPAPEPAPEAVAKAATAGVTAQTGITGYDLITAGHVEDATGELEEETTEVRKAALTQEISAFLRFVKGRTRAGRWRDFDFVTADPVMAHRLNDAGRVEVRKAAGELVAAGLCVLAADTGRVLMLQRGMDPTDPAAGKWEFPGGHIETGEDPLTAASREWCEETGCLLPINGELAGGWTSANGIYEGFIYRIPAEAGLPIVAGRSCVTNPDDPDGDQVESIAWWDPADLPGNPAVRGELGADIDLVLANLSPVEVVKAADADPKGRWHDLPVRRHEHALTAAHSPKVTAALGGMLSDSVLRSLVESYRSEASNV